MKITISRNNAWISTVLLIIAAGWFFLYTNWGLRVITRIAVKCFSVRDHSVDEISGNIIKKGRLEGIHLAQMSDLPFEAISIESAEGSITQTLVLKKIELKGIKGFSSDAVIKIQEASLSVNSLLPQKISVKLFNGKMVLPEIGQVLFYGDYENDTLDVTISLDIIHLNQTLNNYFKLPFLTNVNGIIKDFELHCSGSLLKPDLSLHAFIDNFVYKDFSLSRTPVTFEGKVEDWPEKIRVFGALHITEGEFSSRRTQGSLEKSRIVFSGDPGNPSFAIQAKSEVKNVTITISVSGTKEDPQLLLTSVPSYSQEELLVMLVTGKSWTEIAQTVQDKKFPPDIALDFLDYFFLQDSGKRLSQKLGIEEFTVSVDQSSQGVGIKKQVNSQVDVGYGIKKSSDAQKNPTVSQTIEGSYQVTDQISVEAERTVTQDTTSTSQEEAAVEDKVRIKYQIDF